jgi:hypothetical protein
MQKIEDMIKRRESRFADMTEEEIQNELAQYGGKRSSFEMGLEFDYPEEYVKYKTPKKPEPEEKADGGRIGYSKGKRVKSSIDKLIEQLNKKTKGKKSMESVDPKTGEVTVPKKPIRRAEEPTGMTTMDPEPEIVDEKSLTKNKSRQLTQDEIEDYSEQLGDTETWLSEGTVEEAEKALKRSKAEEAYMYRQYKAGKLDPAPGEQTEARMKFLQKKFDEVLATGDRKLITLDEAQELQELQFASRRKPKVSEADMIRQKYGNVIDEELLQKILIDDNPQRKAEVLASLDEALKMEEKGMSPQEIINIINNTTRTKQADGGIAGLL